MRIYLAGKIDDEYGAWRTGLVGSRYHPGAKRMLPHWLLPRSIDEDYDSGDLDIQPWPTIQNRLVLGIHEYVGPYRWIFAPVTPEGKHLGYFHGSAGYGNHGYDMANDEDREAIVAACLGAINRADLVFAYINRPDCFGTIAEIGMAKALGKFVFIAIADGSWWEGPDYWFIEELGSSTRVLHDHLDEGQHASESARVRSVFKDAIVAWTGRPERLAPVSLVHPDHDERFLHILREVAASFSQIARWSADPRVREEATRMLRRIAG